MPAYPINVLVSLKAIICAEINIIVHFNCFMLSYNAYYDYGSGSCGSVSGLVRGQCRVKLGSLKM